MKPIQTIITLLICILLAACTDTDGIDLGTGTLPADGTPIEFIIADLPATGIEPADGTLPGTRADAPANAKTAWQEGDKLYILTQFDTGLPSDRAIALRTGGQWIFSNNIIAPAGATIIHISANYIGDAPVGSAITGTDVVYYSKTRIPLADIDGPLLLDQFRHRYAYITFTGLAEGDVVTFPGIYGMLTTGYQHGGTTKAPTATVPPGETSVSGYTYIFSNNTYPFAITRGGITTTYPFEGHIYNGRSYTVDCTGLAAGGVGMDEESWENMKEYARFLAWAKNEIDNHTNAPFTLAFDIDLTGYEWTPVGTNDNRYTGTFDGGGHTITGLTVNVTEADAYAGLFDVIGAGGTVKNLHLRGASVTSKNGFAGGIASMNSGIVTGCTVQGTITGKTVAGGIAAANSKTLTGCTFHGDVRAITGTAGGIVGNSSNAASIITGCIMQGTVTGRDYVGGIVGDNFNSATVAGCYSLATAVTRTVVGNTGGIAGANESATITACYWLAGSNVPTKPVGNGTQPADGATGTFTTAAQFTGSMVDAMNTAMRNAGITTHTWTKANATTYPEIITVTNP